MTVLMSPVIRRILALAILVGLVLSFWNLVLDPGLISWSRASRANMQEARLLTEYRTALEQKDAWAALAAQMREGAWSGAFIDGTDQNLASAKFQGDLKQAIESTGTTVTSIVALPVTKDRDVVQLNERVTLSAGIALLPALLRVIEQRVPYVFIDNLSVTAPDNQSTGAPVQLTIFCDFHAYLRPEAM